MTTLDKEPIPKDPTQYTPEDGGRVAVEKLIKFGSSSLDSFATGFKYDDETSMRAYEAFLDVLFDRFEVVVERELEADDPALLQRYIWLDNIQLLETRYFDERGAECGVDYTAVAISEPPKISG